MIRTSVDISLDLDAAADVPMAVEIPSDLVFETSQGIGLHNYNQLLNKPKINGETLVGNKTLADLRFPVITEQEIDKLIFGEGL